MNNQIPDEDVEEQKLLKLYMDLTGTDEAAARSVFMYLNPPEQGPEPPAVTTESSAASAAEPVRPKPRGTGSATALVLFLSLSLGFASKLCAAEVSGTNRWMAVPARAAASPTSLPLNQPLSLADAINLALRQNPAILRAQKDLEAAQGIMIQTRAIALPAIGINGSYSAAQESDVDIVQANGFTFGTPQNWSTQIRLVQSIYQGGRMLSAFRVAKLTEQQSMLNFQTAVADAVLSVQIAYYDVLLAEHQIAVQEASVELLTRELTDATRRFDAGTVPRFNVLRAEVELANARPKLINARSNFRIAKNNLTNLLGFNLPRETLEDIPLILSSKLEAEPYEVELPRAVALAFEKRSELGALRAARDLRKEDVVNAKAGYKPSLQGYFGYDVHNSMLSLDPADEIHGWIGGVQLTWNLFDGRRTQGRVVETVAKYERAGVDLDDTTRRVELEVRTGYSTFIEAREVLESQKKVVEEAEEALRLARARNEAGTGTQLDVLSAQTALTEARTTQIQALHDYEAARARLQRAVGINIPSEPPS